ncbi:hypothetical protein, partial [Actinomadura sp. 7K507]|uniref:hypothetical protein n=1 Tax=Actinomadura sp. 7K507 TaxID=2530365 RepID=UPI00140468C1
AAARRWLGAEGRSLVCAAEISARTGRTDSLNHFLTILHRHGSVLDDTTRLYALTREHWLPDQDLRRV